MLVLYLALRPSGVRYCDCNSDLVVAPSADNQFEPNSERVMQNLWTGGALEAEAASRESKVYREFGQFVLHLGQKGGRKGAPSLELCECRPTCWYDRSDEAA